MITIYGASDDLVEVDGIEIDGRVGSDEFPAYGSQVRDLNWYGDLIALDGSAMRVMAWYGPDGTWLLGVGQVDEDKPLPPWPLSFTQGGHWDAEVATPRDPDGESGPRYSTVLSIDAPEGTRLTNVRPDPHA